jgi:hypothetical protein
VRSRRFPRRVFLKQSLPTELEYLIVWLPSQFCIWHIVIITSSNRVAFPFQYGALRHRKIQTYAFMCSKPIRPYPRQRRIFDQHLYSTVAAVAPDSIQDWYSPERFISSSVGERKVCFSPMRSPASVQPCPGMCRCHFVILVGVISAPACVLSLVSVNTIFRCPHRVFPSHSLMPGLLLVSVNIIFRCS